MDNHTIEHLVACCEEIQKLHSIHQQHHHNDNDHDTMHGNEHINSYIHMYDNHHTSRNDADVDGNSSSDKQYLHDMQALTNELCELCKSIENSRVDEETGGVHSDNQYKHLAPIFFPAIRILLSISDSSTRGTALRCLRYICHSKEHIYDMIYTYSIDIHIVQSYERMTEDNTLWERLQAVKLLQHICKYGVDYCTPLIVHSIVAVASHPTDDFRKVSIELLCDILYSNPRIVCMSDGMRVLTDILLDAKHQDLATDIIYTIIELLDSSTGRYYMHKYFDAERLIHVYTDLTQQDNSDSQSTRACAHHALLCMLRSWSGLSFLCTNKLCISSLMSTLHMPVRASISGSSSAKEAVFDLLFESLQIVRSSDFRLHEYRHIHSYKHVAQQHSHNLLLNYMSVLISCLIECGLIDVLTDLSTIDDEFSSLATSLLAEILSLSQHLLPPAVSSKLLALPSLMKYAAHPSARNTRDVHKVRALHALERLKLNQTQLNDTNQYTNVTQNTSHVSPNAMSSPAIQSGYSSHLATRSATGGRDSFSEFMPFFNNSSSNRYHHITDPQHPYVQAKLSNVHGIQLDKLCYETDVSLNKESAWSISLSNVAEDMTAAHLRRQSDFQLDESDYHALIKKSNVLQTKDYKQWNFHVCYEIVTGALYNPIHLSASLRNKFCKRLLSFQRPEKQSFWQLPWTIQNVIKYASVCRQLFRVLINSNEGREYEWLHVLCEQIIVSFIVELGKDPKELKKGKGHTFMNMHMPHSQSTHLSVDKGTLHPSASDNALNTHIHPKASIRSKLQGSGSLGGKAYRCMTIHDVTHKLAREYIQYICYLFSCQYGKHLFDKYHLYELMLHIPRDSSKDYLTKRFIRCFDYHDPKCREMLAAWMSEGSVWLRRTACEEIRILLRQDPQQHVWSLHLLFNTLHHSDTLPTVLSTLCEASAHPICMQSIIDARLNYFDLGAAALPLIHIVMKSTFGVQLLEEQRIVSNILNEWLSQNTDRCYLNQLDSLYNQALKSDAQMNVAEMDIDGHAFANAGQPTVSSSFIDDFSPNPTGAAMNSATAQTSPTSVVDSITIKTPSCQCHGYRTPVDDYYYARLHDLPYYVDLYLDYPSGKRLHVVCDVTLITIPSDSIQATGSMHRLGKYNTQGRGRRKISHDDSEENQNDMDCDGDSVLQHISPSNQLFAVARPIELDGSVKQVKVDPQCTLRARLHVGGSQQRTGGPSLNYTNAMDTSPNRLNLPTTIQNRPIRSSSSSGLFRHAASPTQTAATPHIPLNSNTFVPPSPSSAEAERSESLTSDTGAIPQYSHIELGSEHVCHSGMRERLTYEHASVWTQQTTSSTFLDANESDVARWQFQPYTPPSGSTSNTLNIPRHASPQSVMHSHVWALNSIWFSIPNPVSSVPCVCVQPHLYSTLAATYEGCDLLVKYGVVKQVTDTIRTFDETDTNNAFAVLQLRSALVSAAHLATSSHGYELLSMDTLLSVIVEMCGKSSLFSVRQTAFNALGIIAHNLTAAMLLKELNWDHAANPVFQLTLPESPITTQLLDAGTGPSAYAYNGVIQLQYPESPHHISKFGASPLKGQEKRKGDKSDSISKQPAHRHRHVSRSYLNALWHISNLCNQVTSKASLQQLKSMKEKNPALFKSTHLLRDVLRLLSTYSYKLPARQFILHDLFDNVNAEKLKSGVTPHDDDVNTNGHSISLKMNVAKPHLFKYFTDGD